MKIYSFSVNTIKLSSSVMKTFKFSLMLRIHENTDVFITLDENIYGIHKKRVNTLYISFLNDTKNFSVFQGLHSVFRSRWQATKLPSALSVWPLKGQDKLGRFSWELAFESFCFLSCTATAL